MSDLARSGRLGVLIAAVATCLIAAFVLVEPWATKKREVAASVVQPAPLFSTPVVPVKKNKVACVTEATITPRSEVARIRVGTRRRPGVPLAMSVTAPGYHATGRIGATWKDNDLLSFPFTPPKHVVVGRVCFRNQGRHVMDFYAADDRTVTRSDTFVDGRRAKAHIQLALYEAQPHTVGQRLGDVVDKLGVFRSGLTPAWIVWLLAVLLLVGVPVAVFWAMFRAAGTAETPAGPPPEVAASTVDGPAREPAPVEADRSA